MNCLTVTLGDRVSFSYAHEDPLYILSVEAPDIQESDPFKLIADIASWTTSATYTGIINILKRLLG